MKDAGMSVGRQTIVIRVFARFHYTQSHENGKVETCGKGRKQKCGLLWSIYVQILYVFGSSAAFHVGSP